VDTTEDESAWYNKGKTYALDHALGAVAFPFLYPKETATVPAHAKPHKSSLRTEDLSVLAEPVSRLGKSCVNEKQS
jgi:hypothetical protein